MNHIRIIPCLDVERQGVKGVNFRVSAHRAIRCISC